MVTPKRVAIYARVSTVDKGQDPETQLMALRDYAERRGFEMVGEYVDYASGTREDRTIYETRNQFTVRCRWAIRSTLHVLALLRTRVEVAISTWRTRTA
jgi:predicted site-specific integrase-resolvase